MKKKEKQAAKRRKISFQFTFSDAHEVVLMGDFNQWDPKKHPMKKNTSGVWEKSLLLAPGTYEYKFCVDGQWKNDPENPLLCPNSFGSKNNFIVV